MIRTWRMGSLCVTALGLASLAAVAQNSGEPTSAMALQAEHVVVSQYVMDGAAIVPKTGKSMTTTGKLVVSRQMSKDCPQATDTCIAVLYNLPDEGVACEWSVLLSSDGSGGKVITENDDAAHYFAVKLNQGEAAAYVDTRVKAVEPPIAAAAQVTGDVVLRVVVGPDGKPLHITAMSGSEMLKGAAIDAAKQWLFKPYLVGKRSVPFQLEMTFAFRGVGINGHYPPVGMKP